MLDVHRFSTRARAVVDDDGIVPPEVADALKQLRTLFDGCGIVLVVLSYFHSEERSGAGLRVSGGSENQRPKTSSQGWASAWQMLGQNDPSTDGRSLNDLRVVLNQPA